MFYLAVQLSENPSLCRFRFGPGTEFEDFFPLANGIEREKSYGCCPYFDWDGFGFAE